MGRRDYRHRESKKSKKKDKGVAEFSSLPPPVEVQVVKKGKKQEEEVE